MFAAPERRKKEAGTGDTGSFLFAFVLSHVIASAKRRQHMPDKFAIKALCVNPACEEAFFISDQPVGTNPKKIESIGEAFAYRQRLDTEPSILESDEFELLDGLDQDDNVPEYYVCPKCSTVVPRHETQHLVVRLRTTSVGSV